MFNSMETMIREQIAARGVTEPRVLDAIRSVPRDLFVPPQHRASAYDDTPLPLDRGQTISQPYIVALMTAMLRLTGGETVLEIGTGSGYQTAILARLARIVYSAELEPELSSGVQERLETLGITNAILGVGDGIRIFRDHGPFDCILAAAAPAQMPEELLDQLAEGGRCVIPVGDMELQDLWFVERVGGELVRRKVAPVRFVPLRQ
ncbi:MAG TPA: protein-L-isoaspartate(D-aspartate) O-methyltransferase [Thermoanaerobaculia bacterium]